MTAASAAVLPILTSPPASSYKDAALACCRCGRGGFRASQAVVALCLGLGLGLQHHKARLKGLRFTKMR